jgi:hypothetical protein
VAAIMIDSLFMEDVKHKKRAFREAMTATSKKSRKYNMQSWEMLDPKSRREYIKGGEIKVSNIYDQILEKTEYDKLDDEQKKTAMRHWRAVFSAAKVQRKFEWNTYNYYSELERLGLKETKTTKPKKKTKQNKQTIEKQDPQTEETAAAIQVLQARASGTAFYVDDDFTSEAAMGKLMKFASFLEGEENRFRIRLEISEIKS